MSRKLPEIPVVETELRKKYLSAFNKRNWEYKFGKTVKPLLFEYRDGINWPDWMDHPSSVKIGEEIKQGFEPYGLSGPIVEDLVTFCNKNGLIFSLHAESPYYPSRTILILIGKKILT